MATLLFIQSNVGLNEDEMEDTQIRGHEVIWMWNTIYRFQSNDRKVYISCIFFEIFFQSHQTISFYLYTFIYHHTRSLLLL